jgi:hypothetical protein
VDYIRWQHISTEYLLGYSVSQVASGKGTDSELSKAFTD